MSSDSLVIHGLELWTRIGVPEEERQTEQRVIIDIEFALDARKAAETDDVTHSIDYNVAVQEIRKLATTERRTIEHLAEDIAKACLRLPNVQNVKVNVSKQPFPDVRGVSLTIHRSRT